MFSSSSCLCSWAFSWSSCCSAGVRPGNRRSFRRHARQFLAPFLQQIRTKLLNILLDRFFELVFVFSNPILLSDGGSGNHDGTNGENNRCPQVRSSSIHVSPPILWPLPGPTGRCSAHGKEVECEIAFGRIFPVSPLSKTSAR